MAGGVSRRRFTSAEYHAMAEAGILSEDERVELIAGEIVEMAPIGSRHAGCVKRLNKRLTRGLGDRALVSVQDPITLGTSHEPEPDLAILRPRGVDRESRGRSDRGLPRSLRNGLSKDQGPPLRRAPGGPGFSRSGASGRIDPGVRPRAAGKDRRRGSPGRAGRPSAPCPPRCRGTARRTGGDRR